MVSNLSESRSSDGFGGMDPTGRMDRFSDTVLMQLLKSSVLPVRYATVPVPFISRLLLRVAFLRSRSRRRVLAPLRAAPAATFMMTNVLPAFGFREVTIMVLHLSPFPAIMSILVLSTRKASLTESLLPLLTMI